MKSFFAGWVLLTVFFLGGCGGSSETQSRSDAQEVSSASASHESKTVDPALTGTIKGKIALDGQAPISKPISVRGNPECAALHPDGSIASEEIVVKDGVLQNVFVYVKKGLEAYSFTAPATSHVIENKKCVYVPHVSGVMTGQDITFLNSDSTFHNVHSYTKQSKSFNIGLPLVGMKQTKKFTAPEIMVSLKCDVHPWMLGYVGVLPHPYFQVSQADGSFELKNLPAGEYEIEAWHEKLGVKTQTVKLSANETKEIEYRFSAS